MTFDFTDALSTRANATAARWDGYPEFHFVGGNIDEDSLPVDGLADAVGKTLRTHGHDMAKYGMESGPQGYMPLREFITGMLHRRAGMSVDVSEILLTSGSLQAMDLVNELLINPGDAVLVEDANYAGALSRLTRMGAQTVPIDLDDGGMCMSHLRTALTDLRNTGRKPKFIYTIPTVQNPTGTVMSRERRLEFLAIADEFDVPIFEDDCYADLVFDGTRPPAIHALDQTGRTIYCGTFSKTIAPALRVGYLVAPWSVMSHVLPLKTDAGSGALEQMVLAEYLPANFDTHVAQLMPMLKAKADTMTSALDEHFGTSAEYTSPIGGIYLWVTLPETVDTTRLAAAASAEGVALNPGPEWSVNGDRNRHRMRLCFGHPSIENIREGIAKLADICHAEFGVPIRSANKDRI